MDHYVEDYQEQNCHIIAYNDEYLLGYHKETKKAIFKTTSFESDLLSEMPNHYIEWAELIFKHLHLKTNTVETDKEYYNTIN